MCSAQVTETIRLTVSWLSAAQHRSSGIFSNFPNSTVEAEQFAYNPFCRKFTLLAQPGLSLSTLSVLPVLTGGGMSLVCETLGR